MGLTTGGNIGAETAKSLEDCVHDVQAIADTAKSRRPEVLVLCHGGPIATPQDAQFILEKCRGVDGFNGASFDGTPAHRASATTAEVKQFAALKLLPK